MREIHLWGNKHKGMLPVVLLCGSKVYMATCHGEI
jgi:hypothetical protein